MISTCFIDPAFMKQGVSMLLDTDSKCLSTLIHSGSFYFNIFNHSLSSASPPGTLLFMPIHLVSLLCQEWEWAFTDDPHETTYIFIATQWGNPVSFTSTFLSTELKFILTIPHKFKICNPLALYSGRMGWLCTQGAGAGFVLRAQGLALYSGRRSDKRI